MYLHKLIRIRLQNNIHKQRTDNRLKCNANRQHNMMNHIHLSKAALTNIILSSIHLSTIWTIKTNTQCNIQIIAATHDIITEIIEPSNEYLLEIECAKQVFCINTKLSSSTYKYAIKS